MAARKGHDSSPVKKKSQKHLSPKTVAGIVIGKMLVMPFIGITTAYFLKQYVFEIPDEIAGAFYLV